MKTSDGQSLQAILDETAAALKQAIASVPDTVAEQRSIPDCWSVVEIAEHIGLVERGLTNYVAQQQAGAEEIYNAGRGGTLSSSVASRAARIEAPSATVPSGKVKTKGEALDEVEQANEHVRKVLAQKEDCLRFLTVQHPILGVISGYEAFLVVASHRRRHTEQVREQNTANS